MRCGTMKSITKGSYSSTPGWSAWKSCRSLPLTRRENKRSTALHCATRKKGSSGIGPDEPLWPLHPLAELLHLLFIDIEVGVDVLYVIVILQGLEEDEHFGSILPGQGDRILRNHGHLRRRKGEPVFLKGLLHRFKVFRRSGNFVGISGHLEVLRSRL